MHPHLPRGRPIGSSLVRLAARLVRDAARRLESGRGAAAGAVHDARVSLKRARSTLRLLERIGAAWAKAPRLRLAALARGMSAAREAAVARKQAAELQRTAEGARREVAGLLLVAATGQPAVDLAQVAASLRREAALLARAPSPRTGLAELKAEFSRSLDRVESHQRVAKRNPGRPQLHEWRKSVIILRDQAGLAVSLWPGDAAWTHGQLVALARRLGRIGDLAVLEARLAGLEVPRALAPERRALVTELRAERTWATMACLREWPALARKVRRWVAAD